MFCIQRTAIYIGTERIKQIIYILYRILTVGGLKTGGKLSTAVEMMSSSNNVKQQVVLILITVIITVGRY